jgi:AsmA protein
MVLESLALEGLTLRPRVAADGRDNWTALVDRVIELAGEGPSAFAVGALTVEGGRVEYSDARAAGGLVLSSVVLEARGIEPARPFPLELRIAGEAGEHVFHAAGETEATLDPDRSRYAFEGASLRGWIGGGNFGTGGADLSGVAQRLEVDFAEQSASLDGLAFEGLGLRGRARVAAASLGDVPVFGFDIDTEPFAPRAVANAFGRPLPATTDPAALGQATVALGGRFDAGGLALERMAGRLDDTSFSGSLQLPPAPAVPRVELTLDAVDLDRYLPPGSAAPPSPAEAVGALFETLAALELDAVVTVGEASLAGTVARQLRVTIEPSAVEPARP